MAREWDAFNAETTPVVGKIRQRYLPFFVLVIGMAFVDKPLDSFTLVDVALIILAIMLVGEFFFELEEFRKKGVVGGSWY